MSSAIAAARCLQLHARLLPRCSTSVRTTVVIAIPLQRHFTTTAMMRESQGVGGGGGYRGRGGGGGGRGRGGGGFGGRGARGGGFGGGGGGPQVPSHSPRTHSQLEQTLRTINNKNYPCYKELLGEFKWTSGLTFTLFGDHIQGDPYSPPSRFRARLPMSLAGFPPELWDTKLKQIALCDYLNRKILALIRSRRMDVADSGAGWSGPKGGDFNIYVPKQQVLERSACVIREDASGDPYVEIRFVITLPAYGRTINGEKAYSLLISQLPEVVAGGLLWIHQDKAAIMEQVESVVVQDALRRRLPEHNLVAFVGNGSILPRASGADPRPMEGSSVIPFESPEGLQVTIDTGVPSCPQVTGMGIPLGVTVVTGGGFHGKTTLLEALELGIYNVIPSDGRQLVVTSPAAFKVRSEDGRSVSNTDISAFISTLPGGKDTTIFTSSDASGSTSMAANILEALEVGATAFLIDEDTSATNFLVRDAKMSELIKSEPISPLVSKVSALYKSRNVSTIIVIGGCGDYLNVATTVIGMDSYRAQDWTARAQEISAMYPNAVASSPEFGNIASRVPTLPTGISVSGRAPRASGMDAIVITKSDDGDVKVDFDGLEQMVEVGQVNWCAQFLRYVAGQNGVRMKALAETVHGMEVDKVDVEGRLVGDLVETRALEAVGVVNRVRGLVCRMDEKPTRV